MSMFWICLVSLFNGISTFMGYLMPKPSSRKKQQWYYLTHSWWDKGVLIPFPRALVIKWMQYYKWSLNSLTLRLQSSTLVIMSRGLSYVNISTANVKMKFAIILNRFHFLFLCFNDISTFLSYLMPKPSL